MTIVMKIANIIIIAVCSDCNQNEYQDDKHDDNCFKMLIMWSWSHDDCSHDDDWDSKHDQDWYNAMIIQTE